MPEFDIHRGIYPQPVGLWVSLADGAENEIIRRTNPPFSAKNIQDMQHMQAGIRQRKVEYIGEWDFLHRDVDIKAFSSTVYPKAKRQADQGFDRVFHSFHKPYYYCWFIYIYYHYFLFGAAMHKAMRL